MVPHDSRPDSGAFRPRSRLLDVLRGIAILVMAGYHLAWDFSYLGILHDITADPVWITLQRLILGSFVFLAGASLVLAHGERIRWRAFWRREAILVAAALAVSLGTWIAFGEYFAFFGVLHALALFALLGLPFLRAPLWLVLAVAAAVIAATWLWTHPAFSDPWLAWIGFWPVSPSTVDLVAVVPWFGVSLLGIAAMRLVLAHAPALLAWQGGRLARGLALVGRWSLVIYLVHQPLLYGAVTGIAGFFPTPQPPALTQAQEFALSCQPGCVNTGAPAAYCTAYCACSLDLIERENLWDALGAEIQSDEDADATSRVINLCRAMAEGGETALDVMPVE